MSPKVAQKAARKRPEAIELPPRYAQCLDSPPIVVVPDVWLEVDVAVELDDGDVVAVGLRREAVVRVQVHLRRHKVLFRIIFYWKISLRNSHWSS